VATFSTLVLHEAGAFTLAVTDGSLASAISSSFTIAPAVASQLVITQQPANDIAGNTLASIIAKLEDQYGNVVTSDASTVTIAWPPAAEPSWAPKLSPPRRAWPPSARWPSMRPRLHAGRHRRQPCRRGFSSFTIAPAAVSQLVITQQPANDIAGNTLANIIAKIEISMAML